MNGIRSAFIVNTQIDVESVELEEFLGHLH